MQLTFVVAMLLVATTTHCSPALATSSSSPKPYYCAPHQKLCPASAFRNRPFACCPLGEDSVCCSATNIQQCCPAGTTCTANGQACIHAANNKFPSRAGHDKLRTHTSNSIRDENINNNLTTWDSNNIRSTALCKLGPIGPGEKPLLAAELGFPVTLVLGDSISIGYTPALRNKLSGISTVYHTPWPIAGGADSVVSAANCIDTFFTNSSTGHPLAFPNNSTRRNVLTFNFGMHDYGETDEVYEAGLRNITRQLLKKLSKSNFRMIYVLTTPVPQSVLLDTKVKKLNLIARQVMASLEASAPGGIIPVVDLHQAIIRRCGAVPYDHATCPIAASTADRPNPHFYPEGYEYLARFVLNAIEHVVSVASASTSAVEVE
jgi:hypothetical protein